MVFVENVDYIQKEPHRINFSIERYSFEVLEITPYVELTFWEKKYQKGDHLIYKPGEGKPECTTVEKGIRRITAKRIRRSRRNRIPPVSGKLVQGDSVERTETAREDRKT